MKKVKLILISFLILICSYLVYKVLIKDNHIRWQFKALNLVIELTSWTFGLGSKFDRDTHNYIKNYNSIPENKSTNGDYINGVLIEEIEINSLYTSENIEINDKDNKFKIKLFIKKDTNEKLPILINIHGGGFVLDIGSSRNFDIAKKGFFVISIHYRLAPEYKYPTALEDCYSAMIWLNETENEFIKKYANLNKIILMGDSAGGNLAAVLPLLLRDRNYPLNISHQVLIYPTMLSKEITESKLRLKDNAYILSNELMTWFHCQYITEEHLYENYLVNPLKNKNFEMIPPALIILATEDILYSEGKLYGQILEQNGVLVQIEEYNTVHGFFDIPGFKLYKEDEEAFNKIIEYFRNHKLI